MRSDVSLIGVTKMSDNLTKGHFNFNLKKDKRNVYTTREPLQE